MGKTTMTTPAKLQEVMVTPPHSVEAEESVLGSVLIDPSVLPSCTRILSVSDFFVVKCGWIWDAILGISLRGDKIDFLMITDELERRGQLAEVGGINYLSQIINSVPTALHAENYARIIKRASIRRKGLNLCSDFAARLYDEHDDPFLAYDRFLARVQAVRVNEASRMGGDVPVMSADEVLNAQFTDPFVAVEGMLHAGLTFLGAKPKMHKSWMALQLLCAISSPTGYFLGRKLMHGRALYISLEDNVRRLHKRMTAQGWPHGLPFDVIYADTYRQRIGNIAAQGADVLCDMMLSKDYRIAVIDPFGKAIAASDSDMYDLAGMTNALAKLQEFAIAHDRVIMFIAHHPKELRETHDPITDIMGTIAIGATMDTAWGIYRERGQQMAEFVVAGRDLEDELQLAIHFDKLTCSWVYDGKTSDLVLTEKRVELMAVLDMNGSLTHKGICEITNQDGGNVTHRMGDLLREGLCEEVISKGSKKFQLTEDGKMRLGEYQRCNSVKPVL